ncbi:hypothetical protein X962_5848 [Burkholderia pseudomallei MSHR7343]|nr:hypothetical protein X962_5848 [Burkholderia pseudomallei MSHR7343]
MSTDESVLDAPPDSPAGACIDGVTEGEKTSSGHPLTAWSSTHTGPHYT